MNYTIADDSGHQIEQSQKNHVNLLLLVEFSITVRKAHVARISSVKALKERFYEAAILISEPESAGPRCLIESLEGLVV